MEKISSIGERLKKIFENAPDRPEPRHNCQWCRDSGMVECYRENGENIPFRVNDRLRMYREKRKCYFVICPCGFCEAGTYRGRPTEGSLKGAERWVKENVTTIASLKGTYEKAEEEGYSKSVIDQAFLRLGVRKTKIAGKWICEPS